MGRKRIGYLLIALMVFSMFMIPIQPVKAEYEHLDYEHHREFDYLRAGQSAVIGFSFLYNNNTPFHWEFTTILDDMVINVSLTTSHSDPYWIEEWSLSSGKTHDYGEYTVPYFGFNEGQYQLHCKNIGNTSGYIMMDVWIDRADFEEPLWNYYVLPENRTEPIWEWHSFNNPIDQYYAVYTSFQADEYDMFFMASLPSVAPILFLDQDDFDEFAQNGDPYDSSLNAQYLGQVDMARPKHEDTWYFVFMNGYEEETVYLNASISFTPNYYGFPPPPEPEPEPEPIPQPPNPLNYILPILIIIGLSGGIGLSGVAIFLAKRQKRK